MKIFFIGDIVGRAGRRAVRKLLPEVSSEYEIDLVIANGENAAGGFGITEKITNELFDYGVDCLTMGNHTWNNKDIFNFIDNKSRLIRPLNYLPGVPGRGWTTININKFKVGVINLIGQVYMGNYNPPIAIYKKYISQIKSVTDLIVIDFHAEATGEKLAFANCVDGQVACVVGTHTHVQTADEKILPKGTGYITDLGLTGATNSILGMKKNIVMEKFRTQLPSHYEVATGQCQLSGVVVTIDHNNKLTNKITRIQKTD